MLLRLSYFILPNIVSSNPSISLEESSPHTFNVS